MYPFHLNMKGMDVAQRLVQSQRELHHRQLSLIQIFLNLIEKCSIFTQRLINFYIAYIDITIYMGLLKLMGLQRDHTRLELL